MEWDVCFSVDKNELNSSALTGTHKRERYKCVSRKSNLEKNGKLRHNIPDWN